MVRCPLYTQKVISGVLFMVTDLQKASLWKRFSAYLLDVILLAVVTVGVAALLSSLLGYNEKNAQLTDVNTRYKLEYEAKYGVEFQITREQYDAMSQPERENYDAAKEAVEEAFAKDSEATYLYNLVMNMTLLILTFGLLIAVLLLEFFVPLLLKNGQTVGKKIFAIALVRPEGVKISNVQLFIRALLGKFTIEIMIPVYVLLMISFNSIGIVGLAVLAAIVLGEPLSMLISKTNNLIHDSIAGTVAVDMSTQMIFGSMEERVEYIKRLHAQEVSRQEY